MVGDLNDVVARLKAMLPKRWFAEAAPNITGLLAALATPFTWLYTLLEYVTVQSRLVTATDAWLDIAAMDFLGDQLPRRIGEPDSSYRMRIRTTLLQDAVTRPALSSALQSLTGTPPKIFEPSCCRDTGAYWSSGSATAPAAPISYNQAGGWGSLLMPGQFFLTVTRPATSGVANLAGYGSAAGGYDVGQLSYVDLAELPGTVSDTEIQMRIRRLLPVNATAWLRII